MSKDVRTWYYEETGHYGSDYDIMVYLWQAYNEVCAELIESQKGILELEAEIDGIKKERGFYD